MAFAITGLMGIVLFRRDPHLLRATLIIQVLGPLFFLNPVARKAFGTSGGLCAMPHSSS